MQIIEFLKKSLEGRGIYPIFMVIYSWSMVVILFGILIYEILLYIFKVKIPHGNFKTNMDDKEKQYSKRK